jgi:hypothetical protein
MEVGGDKPPSFYMKITLKDIIRWEQLTGKSFFNIDYSDEDDLEYLLYVCDHSEVTFGTFKEVFKNRKVVDKMLGEFNRYLALSSQFMPGQDDGKGGEKDTRYMKDIVSFIIVSGVDPHFVMEEMELQDLPLIVKALETKRRISLEDKRTFTYLTMLPHMDTSKLKNGMEDILSFPWDNEKPKVQKQPVMSEEEFDRIMEQYKKHDNGTT